MQPLRPESATLPRGFRFHYRDGERPKTPEPSSTTEIPQPSPPRVPKLRIRRRNVADFTFSAPTEQFLASVAAADVPIPSIEEPEIVHDHSMLYREDPAHFDTGFLTPYIASQRASPPKTPMPQLVPSMDEQLNYRPDWSMSVASTPDDSQTRPSSALSNPSDWSDDSYFSSIRTSRPSDDGSCTSPESEFADPFIFPAAAASKGKDRDDEAPSRSAQQADTLNAQMRTKTRGDGFWTKDMSDHLWQTYQLYLQDPTVTPFRIGASSVPPEGVIHRVAREAKRSWKGPKTVCHLPRGHRRTSNSKVDLDFGAMELEKYPTSAAASKSGSNTPTAELAPRTYLQWQHSSAATRNHLRLLCKRKAAVSARRHHFFQSRSPTPFTQGLSRQYHRPSQSASFSTRDIAFALTTSTSDSMHAGGPLAGLARHQSSSNVQPSSHVVPEGQTSAEQHGSVCRGTRSDRLGSPFSSRTYGPSSSRAFGSLSRPVQSRTQSDQGHSSMPRLRSPVQFGQSSSLNGTQKRRAQDPLDEEVFPKNGVLRPSILNEQLFGAPDPGTPQRRRVRSRGFSLGDESVRARIPGLFVPGHLNSSDISTIEDNASEMGASSGTAAPSLLPSATFDASDMGSCLPTSGTSNTFPRRLFQPTNGPSTIRKRSFATVHHTRRSIESFDFGSGPSLHSRLSQLDEKLAEIRDREEAGRKHSKE
ncbi:MAG: hypothetical protein M1818_004955 [Claussenomyces sp. TS43310]|nr:MAG: hypothetical protein M1818_004955 [Claussenomyces sp. TS43310]